MVRLIGIIVSTLVVLAFGSVAYVFVDRLLFKANILPGIEESSPEKSENFEITSKTLSAALEDFEMSRPLAAADALSKLTAMNSNTRFLKELEYRRRSEIKAPDETVDFASVDLGITIIEPLSEGYLKNIFSDLRKRGYEDIILQRSEKKVFLYGFKDKNQQIDVARILSSSFYLQPILRGFK